MVEDHLRAGQVGLMLILAALFFSCRTKTQAKKSILPTRSSPIGKFRAPGHAENFA